MAQEIIGAKVQLDTSDVKSFKAQLREATQDLYKMSSTFGESSKEAVVAAQKVAKLRDAIGDAKNLVDQFNPDQKFKALTTVVGATSTGFQTLQGAIGLFGSESEDVVKSLQKVQSAMAFSQGINQLGEMRDQLKNAATVIKTQVVGAFSTLKGAIISTGIGALVIALGLIVSNFDAVKEAVLKAIPGLETFGKWIGKIYDATTDWLGVTSDQTRALEAMEKAQKASSSAIENQIKILTAMGGKEKEIYDLKRQQLEAERALMIARAGGLGQLEKMSAKEIQALADLNAQIAVLDASETKRKADKAKEDAKKADEEATKKAQAAVEAQQREDKAIDDAVAAGEERRKKRNADKPLDLTLEGRRIAAQKDADELLKIEEEKNKRILESQERTLSKANLILLKEAENKQALRDANVKLIEEERKAKETALQATGEALTNLSLIAGKETTAGKALAIAASLINTYQGITKSLAAGGFLGIAQAIAVGAAGFAAVKNIVAVQVPGSAGGGTSASAPNMSTSAPITPTVVTPNTTTLDQRSINALGNRAIRAYVVEHDITSGQERITRIQTQTKFG